MQRCCRIPATPCLAPATFGRLQQVVVTVRSRPSNSKLRLDRMAAAPPPALPRSLDTHANEGDRVVAAAADRNKGPILDVLRTYLGHLPPGSLVLEVASGTGQHSAHFAAGLPNCTFQPTERDASMHASMAAWAAGLPNVLPPAVLDATSAPSSWPVGAETCAAVFAANITHISPWAATLGLLAGSAHVLRPGGLLLLYGPFSLNGPTTESNAAFDASLRARNAAWGYREVSDVAAAAAAVGLQLREQLDMPANNFLLVLAKQ